MLLHPKQKQVASSKARFKIVRAGRRSGKTILKVETILFKATGGKDRSVFFVAPTQKQARSIIWEALKTRLGKIGKPNESRLEMQVPTAEGGYSTIFIAGWENRENFRGMKAYHIEFDEVDTMKDFFIGWQEIFRPALIDTGGTAGFGGTPKKENPNLRRLEKEAELPTNKLDWQAFKFTTKDNPHIPESEIKKAEQELDPVSFQQEILAEYVENAGALFKYTALIDMFTNTIEKTDDKYLIVDVADDGSDKTIMSFWQGLECYRIEQFSQMQTNSIIDQIREYAASDRIPYSQIAVDAIGVGAGVASSPFLAGIIGYKSSYSAIKTERDIVRLPNVHTLHEQLVTDYRNLRSQCIFTLANLVNDHEVSVKTDDGRVKSHIIEELSHYQDASVGDNRKMATPKDDVKLAIGRSPDISDTLIMRMYFEVRGKLLPTGEEQSEVADKLKNQFRKNESRQEMNSMK